MPKNKRDSMQRKALTEFFMPTRWKVLALVLLYFGNYALSFFGFLLNSPIYYFFYWGRPAPAGIEGFAIFLIHVAYLYLLSCILVRLLS